MATSRAAEPAHLSVRWSCKVIGITLQSAGALPNYEVSIGKLTVTETIQQVVNLALNAHGLAGAISVGGEQADAEGTSLGWGPLYLDSIRHSIGQGAAEIQRNVVATRGLGLPRG